MFRHVRMYIDNVIFVKLAGWGQLEFNFIVLFLFQITWLKF